MRNSLKIAFCGITAALSAVVMFLTGVVPTATVALPAVAGCFLIPVVAELGRGWGMGVYAVCCVLSFLLAPDREAAFIYILFFGYYPVLLALLGRIRNKALRWAAKLGVFNAAVLAETALAVWVLGIPWENVDLLGRATPAVLLLAANVMFVLYDRVLEGLIALYFQKLHSRVQKALKLK